MRSGDDGGKREEGDEKSEKAGERKREEEVRVVKVTLTAIVASVAVEATCA
jgi:hypothetical protein